MWARHKDDPRVNIPLQNRNGELVHMIHIGPSREVTPQRDVMTP